MSVIYFILRLFDVTKIRHNNFCFRETKCPVSLDKNYLHSGEELNCLYKDIPVIDLNPILVPLWICVCLTFANWSNCLSLPQIMFIYLDLLPSTTSLWCKDTSLPALSRIRKLMLSPRLFSSVPLFRDSADGSSTISDEEAFLSRPDDENGCCSIITPSPMLFPKTK